MIYELKAWHFECDECGANRRIEANADYSLNQIMEKYHWTSVVVGWKNYGNMVGNDVKRYCEWCSSKEVKNEKLHNLLNR